MNVLEQLQQLTKALEAGSYNVAPSQLVQGPSLQMEDLSPVMHNVTFDEKHIKLQKMIKSEACKSTLAQFNRQLSYGEFGGSANNEGGVGQEETSAFVRITVPMCYYSHIRKVTIASTQVATLDGVVSSERAAADAAKKLAADIEFDLFRGKSDYSNAGVFDGNPLAIPALPNMLGLDAQIRMSDNQRNAKDQMFAEYGSDESVVISAGSTLSQDNVEDASVRSALNFGSADRLLVSPKVLSSYNKISYGKERIILAGSPQDATGADLRRQWVSGGTVSVEASRFLSGKVKPAEARPNGPAAPTSATSAQSAGSTTFVAAEEYWYAVTTGNEVGESPALTVDSSTVVTIATSGNSVALTITHNSGTSRYFNVYRSDAGGTLLSAKFIGRVKAREGLTTTVFTDLNNRAPGSSTGFLVQGDSMAMKELTPYSRLKLAVTDLSQPEAFYRFCTLAVMAPRFNVLVDNLSE